MGIRIRKKTYEERLRDLREEKATYNALKVRLAEARDGAVSASVSTAGGSQSYTKAAVADIERLLCASARRLNALIAAVYGRPNPGRPRRAAVRFDD